MLSLLLILKSGKETRDKISPFDAFIKSPAPPTELNNSKEVFNSSLITNCILESKDNDKGERILS